MINSNRRARAALCVLCALTLLAAAGFNLMPVFRARNGSVPAVKTVEPERDVAETDAVARFLTDREQVRALEVLQLNSIILDQSATEDIRLAARRQLLALTGYMEQETTVEGILRMRGYEDAIATVHEACVNVMVRKTALSQSETAFILEIVMRETGKLAGDVKIIPILS